MIGPDRSPGFLPALRAGVTVAGPTIGPTQGGPRLTASCPSRGRNHSPEPTEDGGKGGGEECRISPGDTNRYTLADAASGVIEGPSTCSFVHGVAAGGPPDFPKRGCSSTGQAETVSHGGGWEGGSSVPGISSRSWEPARSDLDCAGTLLGAPPSMTRRVFGPTSHGILMSP